jgi:hypothetical protein
MVSYTRVAGRAVSKISVAQEATELDGVTVRLP